MSTETTITLRQINRGEWELFAVGGINLPARYRLTFDQLRYFAAHAANAVASYPPEKIRAELPPEHGVDKWDQIMAEKRRA